MFCRAFALLLCLSVSTPAVSLWQTLKTEAFTVFYPSGREREAEEILEVLEYYRGYSGDLVGAPLRRVAVVLEDIGTESNGLTDVAFHRILLFRSSPSGGELGYHQNWWRLVGVHEYTHWRHLSSAEGIPAFLTVLFGNAMVPGNFTPGWLKEGICVVAESGTSPYEGRLNEGLFDAYAAVLAKRGRLPSIVQATYNMDVFPGGTGPYLFGGQFVEFLVHTFGRERVSDFFVHYSASILSYFSPAIPAVGLDRSAREVFGESIRSLWKQWRLELMRSSLSFKEPAAAITDHGWWIHSPVFSRGQLYYQRSFPLKPSAFSTTWRHQLLHLDPVSGRSRVLLSSPSSFSGPMRVRSGKLYYALRELDSGYDNHIYDRYGFTSVLYGWDLDAEPQSRPAARRGAITREREPRSAAIRHARPLFREPFRTFEVLADGAILTAVDREDAFGSVIRLHDPADGTSAAVLVTDLLISDIVADTGNLFIVARADWSNAQVYRVSITGWTGRGESLAGLDPAAIRLEQLHDTPYGEAELCLAGDRLFYSATYGARRTLYEYEIDTGALYRSVNSDFARGPSCDQKNGTLYYVGLNARGEDLYREKAQRREIAVPGEAAPQGVPVSGVPTAAQLEIPEAAIARGGYLDNLASLRPRMLYPVFSLDPYELTYQAGAGIAGTSALGDFQYTLLGYYDSYDMLPKLEASLQTNILAPLNLSFFLSAAGVPADVEELVLTSTVELPLYRSLRKGFSYFALGTAGTLIWEPGEEVQQLSPSSVLGFQGASSFFALRIRLPAAHVEDWSGSWTQYALSATLYGSLVFPRAELSLELTGLCDLEGLSQWLFPPVPGYVESLEASRGGFVVSTLSIPLLQIRAGLWNPGLYLGDLFLVPFLSSAFNQDRELQLSYGGAFHLELKTGARDEGFPLDLYAGLGMTLEGQPLLLLGFEIVGYSGGYNGSDWGGAAPQPALRQ